MVHKWKITIPELTGSEERLAYIYLPDSYEYDAGTSYPVLYMFDGHNVFFDSDATFGKCWGLKEYMDSTKTQLIIVAVECNHSPNNGRLEEYSPFNFTDANCGKITGRGKLTMDWMVQSLKPYIDKHYRTLPDREHTFIAGSSMGGLMSLYAVLQYNQYFSRAAALSPSLWTAPDKVNLLIRQCKLNRNTIIYMDYGSKELSNHQGMEKMFISFTSQLLDRQIMLESRIVPGGTHSEASWEKQIPFFMNTLLYRP